MDLLLLFLGKHGDENDRSYIANRFSAAVSFRERRAILLAIQEYSRKNIVYNSVKSDRYEPILVSLVKYIKQLTKPEYIYENIHEYTFDEPS